MSKNKYLEGTNKEVVSACCFNSWYKITFDGMPVAVCDQCREFCQLVPINSGRTPTEQAEEDSKHKKRFTGQTGGYTEEELNDARDWPNT